jgi:hypothetical protein
LIAILLATSSFAVAQQKQTAATAPIENKSRHATIEGVLRDLICPIQNLAATPDDYEVDCAVTCLRGGSPIVIQTADHHFYVPVSGDIPDTDQRARLMPFAGRKVRVVGTIWERDGVSAIKIEHIDEIGKQPVK